MGLKCQSAIDKINYTDIVIPILKNKVAFMRLLTVEYKRHNELRDYEPTHSHKVCHILDMV